MQILYVGNGNYNHRGARYYDVGRKLCNGMTRNGHNVYLLSDRDTAREATVFGSLKLGYRHCNRVFLDTCYNYRPEMILLGHADTISVRSLEKLRTMLPNVRIAQFNVDALCNPHNISRIQSKLSCVDATFVTTAGVVLKKFAHAQGLASYIPNPVDSAIEWPRCHENGQQTDDVFWALRALKGSYAGDPRIEYPMYLEQSGKVKVAYHGMNGRPLLYGAQYFQEIAKAKMGLNINVTRFHRRGEDASQEELYLYASDRFAHYMGSGLLTFAMRINQMDKLFEEDKELICFSSKEELLEKVIHYKIHDEQRRQIAYAGWEKTHRLFNERLVAKYIVERTFRTSLSESYAWPTQTY